MFPCFFSKYSVNYKKTRSCFSCRKTQLKRNLLICPTLKQYIHMAKYWYIFCGYFRTVFTCHFNLLKLLFAFFRDIPKQLYPSIHAWCYKVYISQIYIKLLLAGALVQWFKLLAWKVGDRGFEPRSGIHVLKKQNVGSLRDREAAILTSNRQSSNFKSFVCRAVSSHSSHHPQDVLLAQFSLYVHKCGLKPHLFLFLLNCFAVVFNIGLMLS